MPVDIRLVRSTLGALANNEGQGPASEELIAIDLENVLHRPMVMHQVHAALEQCADHGWASSSKDDFGQQLWLITAAGRERNRRL